MEARQKEKEKRSRGVNWSAESQLIQSVHTPVSFDGRRVRLDAAVAPYLPSRAEQRKDSRQSNASVAPSNGMALASDRLATKGKCGLVWLGGPCLASVASAGLI